ncbi:UPF0678 fatty acid-binding protein-like protein [Hyaloraphidium curvatum]|nr:UPF0678 fatty acid-binding protein-like protein [Hyaloraphidium curvatum]KAI9012288.1 UPF0678 fatty acid-binding protein-like protein [Hyaloraphidium curvatum]
MSPLLHTHANPALYSPEAPASWLIGTWRGNGKGVYPTIKDFDYVEQITFWGYPGAKYLFYTQNTWNPGKNNAPFHAESGFLRVLGPTPDGGTKVELVLAQPNGLASVEEGRLDPQAKSFTIEMKDEKGAARTSTARPPFVTATKRVYKLIPGAGPDDPPSLHYTMAMATTTTPQLTHHLEATLQRSDDFRLSENI